MPVGEPRVRGEGVRKVKGLRLVRDKYTGQTLFKAGDGRLQLPGSTDELRTWHGAMWLFRGEDPVCELAAPLVTEKGEAREVHPERASPLADGDHDGQPLGWKGRRWGPASSLRMSLAAIAHLITYKLDIGKTATLTEGGFEFENGRVLTWKQMDALVDFDPEKSHGLPLRVQDGELHCDMPIQAPNLREFAWRSELERLRKQVAVLTPDVQVPTGGSVAFDVRPDGQLAVIIRKSGRTYTATVDLIES